MTLPSARRVLLTGASGTLGFNVARYLARETSHHAILPVRRLLPLLSSLGSKVSVVQMDLNDRPTVQELFTRSEPDVVVHCAASGLRPVKPAWFDLVSFNVEGTLRLFESYCTSRAKHFIYISTGLVYRDQGRSLHESDPVETVHPYGASKAAADLLLQAAAVEFDRTLTVVRPFAFTGLQDFVPRLYPSLIRAVQAREPFPMTTGDQIRDFCAVEDIARAIVSCVDRVPEIQVEKFNLGTGIPTTVRNLVESVCEDLALAADVRFGAIEKPRHDPRHLVADITAARAVLGWRPAIRLSYAVWELAQEIAPQLSLRKPERTL